MQNQNLSLRGLNQREQRQSDLLNSLARLCLGGALPLENLERAAQARLDDPNSSDLLRREAQDWLDLCREQCSNLR